MLEKNPTTEQDEKEDEDEDEGVDMRAECTEKNNDQKKND